MSAIKISEVFKVSSPTILKVLKEMSLTRKVGEGSILYQVDEDYFKIIDSEEKSYWLGFLYADGCVTVRNQFVMTLKSSDENHLKKFLKCINSNHPIRREFKKIGKNEFELSRISINRNKFCNYLSEKGCMYGKTNKLKFPNVELVPDELLSHFIRGYFDGDGSLTLNHVYKNTGKVNFKISIAGTKDFLDGLKKVFGKENLKLHNRGNFYVLDVVGNTQLKRILGEIIYKDANIYLDRKYEKYMDFKKLSYANFKQPLL